MEDDEVPTFVEVSILCDRCEARLATTADTFPAAQEMLNDLVRKLGWYVADRAASNGSSLTKRPHCDLCPICYQAWIGSNQAP